MPKTCPACGYQRRELEIAPDTECPACGIIYAKFGLPRLPPESAPRPELKPPWRDRHEIALFIGAILGLVVIVTLLDQHVSAVSAFGTLAGGMLGTLILAALALGIYFLPAIVASRRHHRNYLPILLVNMFLGWTFLGWFAALIWSTTDNVYETPP